MSETTLLGATPPWTPGHWDPEPAAAAADGAGARERTMRQGGSDTLSRCGGPTIDEAPTAHVECNGGNKAGETCLNWGDGNVARGPIDTIEQRAIHSSREQSACSFEEDGCEAGYLG